MSETKFMTEIRDAFERAGLGRDFERNIPTLEFQIERIRIFREVLAKC